MTPRHYPPLYVLLADAHGSVIGIDLLTTTEAVGEWSSQHEAEERRQEIATTDSCRTPANACIAHVWLSIHPFADASEVRNNRLSMMRRHQ
jgi:hypothetical protein